MTRSSILTFILIVLSAAFCSADNTTSFFEPIFEGCKEKVKTGKIRGQKLKGRYDGLAVIKQKNGDIYFGDVQDGKPHGNGLYICNTGNNIKNCSESVVYIGRYKDGLKYKGVCLNNESEILYDGLFTNDAPSNTYPAIDESQYMGYFDIIESNNRDWVYIGEISQGMPNGLGIILFKNKDFLISKFNQGMRSGIGLFVASSGEWQTEKAKGGEITIISSSTYYATIDAERNRQIKSHFTDALGYFSQALTSAGEIGDIVTGQPYTDLSNSSIHGSSPLDDNNAASHSGNYQADYEKWEQRAESHYNSITNLGYSATNKNGNKHGSAGQGMSSGNYASMKKSFREAQKQMRSIRTKAAKAGITITQSKWETATISY